MFVINITYKANLTVVDMYLKQHKKYLAEYREKGVFLTSGRKNPRTGGVILAQAESREELDRILKRDPFYWNNIAKYEVTEFEPAMIADGFSLPRLKIDNVTYVEKKPCKKTTVK